MGIGGEKDERVNKESKQIEGEMNETKGLVERSNNMIQDCTTGEIQSANEVANTMHELDMKIE